MLFRISSRSIILDNAHDNRIAPDVGIEAHVGLDVEAMMRRPLASLLAVLLCGCAAVAASPVATVITPRDLNTHPARYDGHDVVVRGFVILGTNGRSLYQSRERFEEFDRAFRAQLSTGDILDLQACGGPTALALNERDTRELLLALQHAH